MGKKINNTLAGIGTVIAATAIVTFNMDYDSLEQTAAFISETINKPDLKEGIQLTLNTGAQYFIGVTLMISKLYEKKAIVNNYSTSNHYSHN